MKVEQEYKSLFFSGLDDQFGRLGEILSELSFELELSDEKGLEKIEWLRLKLKEIFRIIHTIKGDSAVMGYEQLNKSCHKFESIMDKFCKNPDPLRLLNSFFNIQEIKNIVQLLSELAEALKLDDKENYNYAKLADDISKDLDERFIAIEEGMGGKFSCGCHLWESSSYCDIFQELDSNDQENLKEEKVRLFEISVRFDECLLNAKEQMLRLIALMNSCFGKIINSKPSLYEIKLAIEEMEKKNLFFDAIKNEMLTKTSEKRFSELSFVILTELDKDEILHAIRESSESNFTEIKELQRPNCSQQVQLKENKKENEKISLKTDFVRINVSLVHDLITLSNSLKAEQEKLLSEISPLAEENLDLSEKFLQLEDILENLQKDLSEMHLLEVGYLFNKFKPVVKDIGQMTNKKVSLVIENPRIKIERHTADYLNEILVHLIRNAIDHGIENYQTRIKLEKKEISEIILSASVDAERNHVQIQVKDDGKGISPDEILECAIKKELITRDIAETLSKKEILDLIFLNGFSTSASVSGLSGRGLGMDIVSRRIKEMNGEISVETEINKGTSFLIKIPLSNKLNAI